MRGYHLGIPLSSTLDKVYFFLRRNKYLSLSDITIWFPNALYVIVLAFVLDNSWFKCFFEDVILADT